MKIRFIFLFSTLCTLSSCVTTVTSEPQPINVDSEKSIPKILQGTYLDTGLLQAKFTLYETSVISVAEQKKWVSKSTTDSNSYFISNNKLYEIDMEDGYPMSIGFDYKEHEDSISYVFREEKKLFINSDFVLKNIGSRWLLNLKGEKGWWQPYLLEQTENGNLEFSFFELDSVAQYDNFSFIKTVENSLGDINYINAQWTSKDIENMIDNGAFSKSISTFQKLK